MRSPGKSGEEFVGYDKPEKLGVNLAESKGSNCW
jgi:hypothetical protein